MYVFMPTSSFPPAEPMRLFATPLVPDEAERFVGSRQRAWRRRSPSMGSTAPAMASTTACKVSAPSFTTPLPCSTPSDSGRLGIQISFGCDPAVHAIMRTRTDLVWFRHDIQRFGRVLKVIKALAPLSTVICRRHLENETASPRHAFFRHCQVNQHCPEDFGQVIVY